MRPAIGIRLGTNWFFSYHALARNNGPDAVNMLRQIGERVREAQPPGFEDCGPANCDVYTKTSANGDSWASGPSDMGTRAQTSDGLHLQVSPVITWYNGKLYLTAHREVATGGSIPEGQTAILTSTNGGNGPWSWMPAPAVPAAGVSASCSTDYSPYLRVAASPEGGNELLYTTAAASGPHHCQEVDDPITIEP
jgi:hypothetical protein